VGAAAYVATIWVDQHRIRMMEEEDEEKVVVEERGMNATMKVFYGPSAVTIKKNHSNYIDRVRWTYRLIMSMVHRSGGYRTTGPMRNLVVS
jgi:hypothetical protein